MTVVDQVDEKVTVSAVAIDERQNFYHTYFGKYYNAGESLLYRHAGIYVKGYKGGNWNFYTLSNGGFFVAIDTKEQLHFVNADNYCSEHMSAEAVGITLTLFVLGRLLSARIPESESERFTNLYHKLRDFALEHTEAQSILTAID
ncbi:antirestriction protein [Pseudomonas helleri]|uniref:antirestriction protein n=1 Tax=Pseudomonas helleri TaxID=1608996 RepID=UPI003FD5BC23